MNFFVCGISEIPEYIMKHNITHLVTVMTKSEIRDINIPNIIDYNNRFWIDAKDVMDPSIPMAAKKDSIKDALDWSRSLPIDANVLVHCYAGISRSTATALAMKVQHIGLDKIDYAIQWLQDIRPIACPNPVITKWADEILNAKGELDTKARKLANDIIIKTLIGK